MPADLFPDPVLLPPSEGAKPVADPCPACGRPHALHIAERLIADPPPGSYSLVGVQTKAAARPGVVLECRACGANARPDRARRQARRLRPAAMTTPDRRNHRPR